MWQCEPQPKARRVYECGSASRSRRRGESMNEQSPMDPHQRARLLSVLEAEGLDALVATTPENLFYLTGFRSISHAIFRGAELYGIVSRRGTGLVVPFIDTAGVAADGIACDRVACYGTRSQRSEEHTSELQSHSDLVCRLLLEKKKKTKYTIAHAMLLSQLMPR